MTGGISGFDTGSPGGGASHVEDVPVALVTGASGGIGRATVVALARDGMDVLAHASQSSPAAGDVVDQIEKAGRRGLLLTADLADEQQVEKLAKAAWQWRGRVDVLVNLAGVDVLTSPADQWTLGEKLSRLWQVDVAGTWWLSRAVSRRMIKPRRASHQLDQPWSPASIVNVGWDQAWQGMEGDSGQLYSIVKGAVMSLTLSLAQSLAPWVRVNCVAPGWIQTKWGQSASDYWQQRAVKQSLANRWGQPEDVAQAIAFLCSRRASFISGQILDVNGGFRHWTGKP